MTQPIFVSNSSPVIAFERLNASDLLHRLTDTLYIPLAVRREVFGLGDMPSWISERTVSFPVSPRILGTRLGPGESEAIALALEMLPCRLLVDDLAARRTAQAIKIPVLGTVGLLILAHQRNLLSAIKPSLDALMEMDFRISKDLYSQALQATGESIGPGP